MYEHNPPPSGTNAIRTTESRTARNRCTNWDWEKSYQKKRKKKQKKKTREHLRTRRKNEIAML